MRYDWASLAITLGICLSSVGLMAWMIFGTERRLRRWAEAHGLTVLRMRQAMFRRGPFARTGPRTDFVYRLTARDPEGDVLEGWARLPGLVVFPFRGAVEVRWVGRSPAPAEPRA